MDKTSEYTGMVHFEDDGSVGEVCYVTRGVLCWFIPSGFIEEEEILP